MTERQTRRHLRGPQRVALADQYAAAYLEGKSIRAIMAANGDTFGRTRNLIIEGGATLRPRGGKNPR